MIKKVFLPFLLLFLFSTKVFAVSTIVINDFPDQIQISQEFDITFSATELDSESQYYVKARIGIGATGFNQAETYNSVTSVWLSDTSVWSGFPVFVSNSSGNMAITVKVRTKQTVSVGQNKLTVRLRKVNVDPNIDSDEIEINIIQGPSPTVSPTLIPTIVPTIIPTATVAPTISFSPTPTQTSFSNIVLSEFIPNPVSGNEKVEIFNNNDFAVNLTNCKIDDIENNGNLPKEFNAQIPAKSYYVIDLDSTSFLNNNNDDVRLLDYNGAERDKKSYSDPPKGKSFAKDSNGNWCWQESSFGNSNGNCVVPTNTPTATVKPTVIAPSLTPVPTKKITVTPTSKISITPVITLEQNLEVLPEDKVLGTNAANDKEVVFDENKENKKENSPNKLFLIPIVIGVCFLGFAVFQVIKNKVK